MLWSWAQLARARGEDSMGLARHRDCHSFPRVSERLLHPLLPFCAGTNLQGCSLCPDTVASMVATTSDVGLYCFLGEPCPRGLYSEALPNHWVGICSWHPERHYLIWYAFPCNAARLASLKWSQKGPYVRSCGRFLSSAIGKGTAQEKASRTAHCSLGRRSQDGRNHNTGLILPAQTFL